MKKKNPQDATLRNIRALKTRLRALELAHRQLAREWKRVQLTQAKQLLRLV